MEVGRLSMHERHGASDVPPVGHLPEHVAGDEVAKVGGNLDHFRAKLDFGPKIKFAQLGLLSNFH
jgi:hypothetical protein